MNYPIEEKLKNEIEYLKSLNKNESLEIIVHNISMFIDVEVLIKEKEDELKNLKIYIDGLEEERKKIEKIQENIEILSLSTDSVKDEEIQLYFKGVSFGFDYDKLLFDLNESKNLHEKHHKDILYYLNTGINTY